MPPILDKPFWMKGLLAGSLIFILMSGLLEIPEVWVRLNPRQFWRSEAERAHSAQRSTKRRIAEAGAQVHALKRGLEVGLPAYPGVPAPGPRVLEANLERALAELHHYEWQSRYIEHQILWAEANLNAVTNKTSP